jgi:threonine dehydratase
VRIDGTELMVKLETTQPTGSFKVRGALVALAAAAEEEAVVACSAGNHGLGMAWAAQQLGRDACVVVPRSAASVKVRKLRELGVELIAEGADYDEAEAAALQLAEERSARFISPYDDTEVIAGQSTLLAELLDQVEGSAEVVVAVGGGGLLAGSLLAAKGTELVPVGAQVEQNAAFTRLLGGGSVGPGDLLPTIADGIAGGIEEDAASIALARTEGVDIDLVSEAELHTAMAACWRDLGIAIEGSAAVALAVSLQRARRGRRIVCVLSGGNVDPELFDDLRSGAEGLQAE